MSLNKVVTCRANPTIQNSPNKKFIGLQSGKFKNYKSLKNCRKKFIDYLFK